MLNENYFIRGFVPVSPDLEGIAFYLDFIVEDSSGRSYLCGSGGNLIEIFIDYNGNENFKQVLGDLKINVKTHALFQRKDRVYVALRNNNLFNQITIYPKQKFEFFD